MLGVRQSVRVGELPGSLDLWIGILQCLRLGCSVEMCTSNELPSGLTWKSSMARRCGSSAIQIRAGITPTFTIVLSTNILRVSLGFALDDPGSGTSLCTHLHACPELFMMTFFGDLGVPEGHA